MKRFSIEKLGSVRERLGSWEVSTHVPVQSPGLWLTTSTCGVPHLTPESFEMSGLQEHFAGVLVSYEKQARSIDIYEAYKKGFADFCDFKNFPTLLTVKDPMLTEKPGYSTFKNISVWGENNQRYVRSRPVVPGGAGDAMAPPDFGRSVIPISTRRGRSCPPPLVTLLIASPVIQIFLRP